jgi:hypothetical protein
MGAGIIGLVKKEAVWSCALNPLESSELDERLEDLVAWLYDHGVTSPLLAA